MNTGLWFAMAATMIHTLWVGALVGLMAVAMRWGLAAAGARVRYGVALGWLGVLAVTPIGTAAWVMRGEAGVEAPKVMVAGHAEVSGVEPTEVIGRMGRVSAPVVAEEMVREERSSVERVLVRWNGVASVLPAVWLVGAGGMLMWSLAGLAGAGRLRRASEGATPAVGRVAELLAGRMGLRRVGVLVCGRVTSPVLVGIVRPVILLPAALVLELSVRELEMILIHELAHVRRWDNLVNLLQRVVESALFFHPAVWVVSGWVRAEREHCCDDVVLAMVGGGRREYADVLVRIGCGPVGVGMSAARGGNLAERVRRIVTRREAMRVSRGCLAMLVGCAVLSGALLVRSAGAAEGKVLTVAKEGGQYASIQAAVDAATEGMVVRVGPGRWEESVTIRKGVTVEGAGWDKTVVTAAVPAEAREAVKELAKQVDKGTSVGEWKARVDALEQKFPGPAVIRVEGARGVVIRGMKLAGSAGVLAGGTNSTVALVVFERSVGQVADCIVTGSPGNGINVSGASEVGVVRCLVSGVWGTGIAIGSRDAAAKVRVADSDVRNCYYAGIGIGRGCEASITGCRIWGTGWHAIRYDDASPTITGNRIYNVARSGIYASGETHATVSGNLFLNNEMDGVSCWFANQDVIEGNTFVVNQREGLAVLGGSKPTVRHNIFVGQPVAVSCSAISGDRSKEPGVGQPKLEENWFWKNVVPMQKPGEKEMVKVELGAETKSRVEEVRFVDEGKRDYALVAGSAAREAKVGVADPLGEASPFPTQAEEKEIAPDGGSWDYRKWKKGSAS